MMSHVTYMISIIDEEIELRMKKSTIGAAVAGGIIGSIMLGPFIGVALGMITWTPNLIHTYLRTHYTTHLNYIK